MSVEFICDGCGKRAPGNVIAWGNDIYKPDKWFQRSDKNETQHACSRECIEKIAIDKGTSRITVPEGIL